MPATTATHLSFATSPIAESRSRCRRSMVVWALDLMPWTADRSSSHCFLYAFTLLLYLAATA